MFYIRLVWQKQHFRKHQAPHSCPLFSAHPRLPSKKPASFDVNTSSTRGQTTLSTKSSEVIRDVGNLRKLLMVCSPFSSFLILRRVIRQVDVLFRHKQSRFFCKRIGDFETDKGKTCDFVFLLILMPSSPQRNTYKIKYTCAKMPRPIMY